MLNNKQKDIFALILFISCAFLISNVNSKIINGLYHTTEELYQVLDKLVDVCPFTLVKRAINYDNKQMIYYTLGKAGAGVNTSAFIFGEHSREIITTELALYFIKSICSKFSKYDMDTRKEIMKRNYFIIVPIVNEFGRKKVEQGNYCKRTNENGVDLNRNWDNHWKKTTADNTFSGNKPFSEWQTKILKHILEKYKATIHVSIHSGVLGMYIPFAYKTIDINNKLLQDSETKKLRKMITVLKSINKKYCKCRSGPAANELFYLCPGNNLDYAFENNKSKYAFAFEIYDGDTENPEFLKIINSDKPKFFNFAKFTGKSLIGALVETGSSSNMKAGSKTGLRLKENEEYIKNEYKWDLSHGSCFSQTSVKIKSNTKEGTSENNKCLKQFNPITKKHFDNTLINWTNVLFQLVSSVNSKTFKSLE